MSNRTHVKRTYSSRQHASTTGPSTISSKKSAAEATSPRAGQKRPLADVLIPKLCNIPIPIKRTKYSSSTSAINKPKPKVKSSTKPKQKTLIQLHFATDQTTLRNCPLCDLSYTKGAPEDESLHRSHCARVQRGMEWGKEEERESVKVGVVEVASQVKLANGKRGRIISCPAECTGKIGSKISALLQTINLSLSSPPLTQECLRNSKVYLFLLPHSFTTSIASTSASSGREKIVGCVMAQRIATAMAVASIETVEPSNGNECNTGNDNDDSGDANDANDGNTERRRQELVVVDSGTGLFCHPQPLSTPMGIPRLFVPSTYRRQGIATALLSAAAATFIHGCPLDPRRGQVAFTQPTGDGKAMMMKWGEGGARIYEE